MPVDTWTTEEFAALCADLGQRADADPAFRARALADAPVALRELAGRELPPGSERFVLAEAPEGLVLGLPDAGGELDEADLEQVVGGVTGSQLAASTLFGALAGGAFAGYEHYKGRSGTTSAGLAIGTGIVVGAALGFGAAVQKP